MKRNKLAGTMTLLRLAIKRDRLRLSLWLLGITFLTAGLVATFSGIFADEAEVSNMIRMFMANPAMRALLAPASGISLGGFFMMRSSTLIAVLIALMSVNTINRHTRQSEETGRLDLIGSTVVGHQANLASAVVLNFFSHLILIVLMTGAFVLQDLEMIDAFLAASALTSTGIAFTGVAAVAAQLAETGRGASSISGLAIGITFLFSAAGNMLGTLEKAGTRLVSAWPTWLSPFGWYQQVHAFHENRWSVLLLPLAFSFALIACAGFLAGRRDVGMGIFPARRGRNRAKPSLLSPWGFAFRLQRNAFFIWTGAMMLTGALFGAASGEFNAAISDLERADEIFGPVFDMDEIFMMMIIGIVGSFCIFYTVQALSRMAGEEKDGYLEHLMATPLPRLKWLFSHLVFVFVGTGFLLLSIGLVGGLAALGEDQIRLGKVVEAALLQGPAVLLLAGLGVALFGILPRQCVALSWLGLGISLLAGPFLGPALELPDWVQNMSPFTHVPAPGETFSLAPLLIMAGVAIALSAFGATAFYQRSLKRP